MKHSALTFLGDVFLKDEVELRVDLPGAVILNLEAPLTDREVGYPGKINLRSSAAHLVATFAPPPVAVSLANNHVMDFGEDGYLDTIANLARLGIAHFGAGSPADDFHNPLMLEVAGRKVAVLGYAHASSTPVFHGPGHSGAARLDLETVTRDIASSREHGAERVAVIAHWGHEQVDLPSPECVGLARAIIEAGADLIVGHHSHCIQSFEVYHDKHIFYGLGNCIFPAHRSPSYFDETGRSTQRADSRPSLRNRRSLAVTWDPTTEEVEITPLVFGGGSLSRARFNPERHRMRLDSLTGYEARYARAYKWGKMRHTIARFMSNPKLPRLHHFRSITKQIRSGTQR